MSPLLTLASLSIGVILGALIFFAGYICGRGGIRAKRSNNTIEEILP